MNIKQLIVSTAASALMLGATVIPAFADSTVVVTGNTSAGENDPGWMFGRDVSNQTPYQFNNLASSIGIGSLNVKPILANAASKFIGEHFINKPIADLNSISYDFKIGPAGLVTQEEQFYMNVYANFGESDDLKFYDCRYNIVPTSGSKSSFTTVIFDPDLEYPVAKSGSSPFNCPSKPADMNNLSPGSNIRVYSLNVGDTSVSDVGLDGFLDNVVVNLVEEVTTYNFEPYARTAVITSPTVNQEVWGLVNFTASLDDDDADAIQWAVRAGTCAAATGTVFGNVDGKSDVATIDTSVLSNQTFAFTGDMSAMTPGMYCFIYNPSEDGDELGIRETVQFNLVAPVIGPPTSKDQCKKDGWMTFNNPTFKNQGDCVSYLQSNANALGNKSK